MIPEGSVVADIGTDHGYLPIRLVRDKAVKKVIACDVRESPLSVAVRNAREAGVSHLIDFRLSDGLEGLDQGEADVYVICGMGGFVIMGILEAAIQKAKIASGAGFIMSPHSDEETFRRFLYKNGFFIKNENMICDSGMFYVIFSCVFDMQERQASENEYRYGRIPLLEKQPALKEYLLRENRILNETKEKLEASVHFSEKAGKSLVRVQERLKVNEEVLRTFR